jgi:hypothetical protein
MMLMHRNFFLRKMMMEMRKKIQVEEGKDIAADEVVE